MPKQKNFLLETHIESMEKAISEAILERTSLHDALNLEIQAIMHEAYTRGVSDATRMATAVYKSLETKGQK
jgi:hypothetical protein